MKSIVKKIAVLTLAFALAVAGASVVTDMGSGVMVAHDGPQDENSIRP